MQKVEMNDHQFAKWLFAKDEKWKFQQLEGTSTVQFMDRNGKILAVAVYNNQKGTRDIIIRD